MKTKIFKTLFFILITIIGFGIFKFIGYNLDMEMANIAPQQLNSDFAYDELNTFKYLKAILTTGKYLFVGLIGWGIFSVWKPKKVKEEKE